MDHWDAVTEVPFRPGDQLCVDTWPPRTALGIYMPPPNGAPV
jgi:hypothetical protein